MITELDLAIKHWWDNARKHDEGLPYSISAGSCSLCMNRETDYGVLCDMKGSPCPIYQVTQKEDCFDTPWYDILHKELHPVVMAWWLEDLRAGRASPFLYGSLAYYYLKHAFPFRENTTPFRESTES
jgi:hypothetical protein